MDVAAAKAHGIASEAFRSVIADRETVVLEFERDGRPVGCGLGRGSPGDPTSRRVCSLQGDAVLRPVATGLALARGPFGNSINSDDEETLSLIATFLEFETDVNPLTLPTPA
jgi:hypothetical protein